MLCCLMLSHLTAWADDDPNTIVFSETFDQTKGTGGRDGVFTGSVGSSAIKYDNDGWTEVEKCGGASQCLKFGTGSASGTLTSPAISVSGADYVLLTFSAAGWGDSNKNKLNVLTNDGFTIESGDYNITELENEEWNDYTVLIKVTDKSATLQLTFTGKRGFLDDIVVRALKTVPAPTLPDNFTFFPETSEEISAHHVMLTPVSYTAAYYTTDGSEPSNSNGTEALLPTNIPIHGTTTVKAVAYVGDMPSEVVSRTYTEGITVNGIAAFCELADDTEAQLFLADDATHETRVLYYDETRHQLFLRDKQKALCIDFGETATFNPTPKYTQHIAGWIVGKKSNDNGLPKLVATTNTSTDFLAIADPVTESQTEPNAIATSDIDSHAADWVTLSEQRVGEDLAVIDRFGTAAYDQALADLSGILIPNGSTKQIAPITQNSIPAVVYVIDENKAFTSPASDLDNVSVRLNRTLSKDYWNTFAVPFDITTMDAAIREYDDADGNTMKFKNATGIVAGKPYLVKPNDDIVNPTFNNVTLTAAASQNVTRGDYRFVATYSPKQLATDKTELFINTNGRLGYPQTAESATLKGMRAYIKVPQNANVSLFVDDDEIITGISDVSSKTENGRNDIYNLNGQRVTQPGKGLYIVNGKKLIIH